jgi:ascorbate-specific PTS system EIIC-type component UlaA
MNINEILTNSALFIGLVTFLGMCFWTIQNLNKDDKKHKLKPKKA